MWKLAKYSARNKMPINENRTFKHKKHIPKRDDELFRMYVGTLRRHAPTYIANVIPMVVMVIKPFCNSY